MGDLEIDPDCVLDVEDTLIDVVVNLTEAEDDDTLIVVWLAAALVSVVTTACWF